VHGWIQRKLQYLGQISYGLYCYHCFGILLLKIVFSLSAFEVYKNTLTGFWLGAVLAFGVTVLLAHVSYVYVEKRILRLKERFW
jgi:peptidoglycan/LPS O-acetylase OafA/YrhL